MRYFMVFMIIVLGIMISPFVYLWFDDVGDCVSSGNVWDYDKEICRKDCLLWSKKTGCVKMTNEEVDEFEKCKYQSLECYKPIYDKMFPDKCFEYEGAYNLDEDYCDFEFDLNNCFKLEGNWQYSDVCG